MLSRKPSSRKKHLMKKLFLLAFCTLAALSGWAADTQPLVPQVSFTAAPLKPTAPWADGPSVVLDHPAHHSDGADATTIYEPVREGGFRIRGSGHRLNRYIVQGQNRLWTGDTPFFQLDSFVTDNQPTPALWEKAPLSAQPAKNRKAMSDINLRCSLGSLRLGVPGEAGRVQWLDALGKATTTTFWPGHTDYEIVGPSWKATVRIAPTIGHHGLVCDVRFDRPTPLVWQYASSTRRDSRHKPSFKLVPPPVACLAGSFVGETIRLSTARTCGSVVEAASSRSP